MQSQMKHITDMLNGLMGSVAQAPSVPNIPGWPQSLNQPPPSITPPPSNVSTMAVSGQPGSHALSSQQQRPPAVTAVATLQQQQLPPATAVAAQQQQQQQPPTASGVHQPPATVVQPRQPQESYQAPTPSTHTNPTVGLQHLPAAGAIPQPLSAPLTNVTGGAHPHLGFYLANPVPTSTTQARGGAIMLTNFTPPFGAPPLNTVGLPAGIQPPASNARRTSAADSDGDASVALGNSARGSDPGSRGRGLARSRRPNRPESVASHGIPGDGYEGNRERRETFAKTLPIKDFSPSNMEQDFALWILQYENAVNRSTNPHSKRRHHKYCMQYLPNTLETDAFAIWQRAENAATNWEALKAELITAFEDPTIRAEWKTNMKAFMWDEDNMSLQAYSACVKRYVDTFDNEFATTPAAKKAQYYIRFVNGLPDDYIEQTKMVIRSNNMDKAMDICICFQSIKKARAKAAAKDNT